MRRLLHTLFIVTSVAPDNVDGRLLRGLLEFGASATRDRWRRDEDEESISLAVGKEGSG